LSKPKGCAKNECHITEGVDLCQSNNNANLLE
jgi:hypothetical protein